MSRSILVARDLHKTFRGPDGGVPVLQGADLELRAGESVSIRGESGAGKSTLLHVLAALEMADSGQLYWEDEAVFNKSSHWQAARRTHFMGFVFQAYYLIPELNALENVLLARRLAGSLSKGDKERAEALLERVGLEKRARHLPNQLSGGERQRVAIARALMNRPALLLADEPTGNLDEHTGEEIMNMLLKLCDEEQTALILVTHNADFARRTQRELRMAGGRLDIVRNNEETKVWEDE